MFPGVGTIAAIPRCAAGRSDSKVAVRAQPGIDGRLLASVSLHAHQLLLEVSEVDVRPAVRDPGEGFFQDVLLELEHCVHAQRRLELIERDGPALVAIEHLETYGTLLDCENECEQDAVSLEECAPPRQCRE